MLKLDQINNYKKSMKNPFESPIPKPTLADIDSIIRHAGERNLEANLDEGQEKINQKLNETVIDDFKKPISQARIIDKEVLDYMKKLREKSFSEASNWTELKAIIICKGSMVMANIERSAEYVINLIEKVKQDNKKINELTNTDNLRAKVIELIEAEKE